MDISDCSKDLTFFNCFPVGLTNDSVLFKKKGTFNFISWPNAREPSLIYCKNIDNFFSDIVTFPSEPCASFASKPVSHDSPWEATVVYFGQYNGTARSKVKSNMFAFCENTLYLSCLSPNNHMKTSVWLRHKARQWNFFFATKVL